MPKKVIDYSNTIIYKITCKNTNVIDKYVGHTTNFVQRKHAHKNGTINKKSPTYNSKIYRIIRENGGWDNWSMEMINFYNCKDLYEAREKEQEHYVILNANMNSIEPLPICQPVNSHKVLNTMYKFTCDPCNYKCDNKKDFNKHMLTDKHCNIKTDIKIYSCDNCEKTYNFHSGLWKHKKTCKPKLEPTEDVSYIGIINQLLSQNNELKNFIIEQASEHKKDTVDIMNKVIEQANEHKKDTIDMVTRVIELSKPSITTNNNNNKFNINVFLSEQCKDAINFSDFIKNIEVSREDIQNTGQLGFVDGISKILMDNLKQLGVNERPIHCTDLKRETMYIKDEDKWNKEENDSKLRSAIQTVSRKSIKTLQDWKEVNPDYENGDSDFSTECLSMQRHSVAGDDREVYFPKVAKLVAKEVIIDKNVV